MSLRAFGLALVHVTAFLLSSLLWVGVLGVLMFVGLTLTGRVNMGELGTADDLYGVLGPGVLGAFTLVQSVGFVVIAAFLAALLAPHGDLCSRPRDAADLRDRWRRAFALRPAALPLVLGGAVGALTVGFLPGWIQQRMTELMPGDYVSAMDVISDLMLEGPLGGRLVLGASIVLGAPLLEELVFRGYLWEVFERAASPAAAWLGTTLLFALYHQDPVHIVSLLPTAFVLGWLRYASASLWPAVAAHFVNNGLSTVVLLTSDPSSLEQAAPLWVALLGFGFTCAACAVGWAVSRRRSAAA